MYTFDSEYLHFTDRIPVYRSLVYGQRPKFRVQDQ